MKRQKKTLECINKFFFSLLIKEKALLVKENIYQQGADFDMTPVKHQVNACPLLCLAFYHSPSSSPLPPPPAGLLVFCRIMFLRLLQFYIYLGMVVRLFTRFPLSGIHSVALSCKHEW